MPLCKYGCGQEGLFSWIPYRQTKSEYRCSEHRNKCPELIRKNSLGNQKTPEERDAINEKVKATNRELFGVDWIMQSEEGKKKHEKTCLERYGATNPFGNKEIREQMYRTMTERYGAPFAVQVPELNKKRLDTLEERHGVRNPGALGDVQSKECCEWLDWLDIPEEWREEPVPGTPYTADAYDSETETLYEYYGDFFHGGPTYKDRRHEINVVAGKTFAQLYAYTMTRQEHLEKKGYTFVVIWSSEWHKLRKTIGQQL